MQHIVGFFLGKSNAELIDLVIAEASNDGAQLSRREFKRAAQERHGGVQRNRSNAAIRLTGIGKISIRQQRLELTARHEAGQCVRRGHGPAFLAKGASAMAIPLLPTKMRLTGARCDGADQKARVRGQLWRFRADLGCPIGQRVVDGCNAKPTQHIAQRGKFLRQLFNAEQVGKQGQARRRRENLLAHDCRDGNQLIRRNRSEWNIVFRGRDERHHHELEIPCFVLMFEHHALGHRLRHFDQLFVAPFMGLIELIQCIFDHRIAFGIGQRGQGFDQGAFPKAIFAVAAGSRQAQGKRDQFLAVSREAGFGGFSGAFNHD